MHCVMKEVSIANIIVLYTVVLEVQMMAIVMKILLLMGIMIAQMETMVA